jgi:hypothetical protein
MSNKKNYLVLAFAYQDGAEEEQRLLADLVGKF